MSKPTKFSLKMSSEELLCLDALAVMDKKTVVYEIHRAIDEYIERRKQEKLTEERKKEDELKVWLSEEKKSSINPNENIVCDIGDDD